MSNAPTPETKNAPAAELMRSLSSLSTALSNVGLLKRLDEQRRSREAQAERLKGAMSSIKREGRGLGNTVKKADAARVRASEKATQSEGPLVRSIRECLIEPARKAVNLVQAAVDAGGAGAVDRAVSPGSLLNRVEVGVRLDELTLNLSRIDACLQLTSGVLSGEATELESHTKWLRGFERRLSESVRALGDTSKGPSPFTSWT